LKTTQMTGAVLILLGLILAVNPALLGLSTVIVDNTPPYLNDGPYLVLPDGSSVKVTSTTQSSPTIIKWAGTAPTVQIKAQVVDTASGVKAVAITGVATSTYPSANLDGWIPGGYQANSLGSNWWEITGQGAFDSIFSIIVSAIDNVGNQYQSQAFYYQLQIADTTPPDIQNVYIVDKATNVQVQLLEGQTVTVNFQSFKLRAYIVDSGAVQIASLDLLRPTLAYTGLSLEREDSNAPQTACWWVKDNLFVAIGETATLKLKACDGSYNWSPEKIYYLKVYAAPAGTVYINDKQVSGSDVIYVRSPITIRVSVTQGAPTSGQIKVDKWDGSKFAAYQTYTISASNSWQTQISLPDGKYQITTTLTDQTGTTVTLSVIQMAIGSQQPVINTYQIAGVGLILVGAIMTFKGTPIVRKRW